MATKIGNRLVKSIIDEDIRFDKAITPSDGLTASDINDLLEDGYRYYGWHEDHQTWYLWEEDPRELLEEEEEEDEEDED